MTKTAYLLADPETTILIRDWLAYPESRSMSQDQLADPGNSNRLANSGSAESQDRLQHTVAEKSGSPVKTHILASRIVFYILASRIDAIFFRIG